MTRRRLQRDAESVARDLLGCRLVRVIDGERLSGIIVETEAYVGVRDKAAHSYGNRRTPRNEAMYHKAGTCYVYFTYGMHHCVNVVCGKVDEPVAVLIRALEPDEGAERMRSLRLASRRGRADRPLKDRDLCSGPAKLCGALGITRALNATDLIDGEMLRLETGIGPIPDERVGRTARIGVGYAQEWASRPLRWVIRDCPHLSRR